MTRLLITTVVSQLKVPDEDYDITVIYRAQVGGGRTSEALDNSALLSTCEQFGDSAGSLQFVLGTISFPRSSAVQQPPSPPELSIPVPLPRIQSKEVQLRDYPDGLGGYEASDEGSSKRSGMITGTHKAPANLAFPLMYHVVILGNFHISFSSAYKTSTS